MTSEPPVKDASAAVNSIEPLAVARDARRFVQQLALWSLMLTIAVGAILLGLSLRNYCWQQTEMIRATPDIDNAFRQGTKSLQQGYLNVYDLQFASDAPKGTFDLDYAPARLLIATLWTRWVRIRVDGYPKDGRWIVDWPQGFYDEARRLRRQDELCRPLLFFNSAMEITAALAMFVLVRHWTLPRRHSITANFSGLISSLFLWFNPALICDSHCWPQWDCWLLPFFLWAVVAASVNYWFTSGAIIALGVMFKSQILLVAPMFVLWPLWRGQLQPIFRCAIGFMTGVACCAAVWLVRVHDAPEYRAIIWVIGVTGIVPLLYFLLKHKNSRFLKAGMLCLAMGLVIWPLLPLGRTSVAGGLFALALMAIAILLASRRFLWCVTAAWVSTALFLCVPVFGGSLAWYKIGVISGSHQSTEMIAGPDCNLAAILQAQWNWRSLDPALTLNAGRIANDIGAFLSKLDPRVNFTVNQPLLIPLGYMLFMGYLLSLVWCSVGAAWHSRKRSPRFLLAIAAPWIVMFTVLPQMHERYLVWGAAISAATLTISPGFALLSLFVSFLALMQQVTLMTRGQFQEYASVRFMNGATPGIGWALMLAAGVYLYFAAMPESQSPLEDRVVRIAKQNKR